MYAELVRASKTHVDAAIHTVQAHGYLWTDVQGLLKKGEAGRSDFSEWLQQVDAGLSAGSVIILAAQVFQGRGYVTVGYSVMDAVRHEIKSLWVAPDSRGQGIADHLYGMSAVNIGTTCPSSLFPLDMRSEAESICKRVGGVLTEDKQQNVLALSV